MGYALAAALATFYILLGFGTKALLKKSGHWLGNACHIVFLWPFALILAAVFDDYLER